MKFCNKYKFSKSVHRASKKMTVEQNLHFYSRLYGIKNFKDVIDNLILFNHYSLIQKRILLFPKIYFFVAN